MKNCFGRLFGNIYLDTDISNGIAIPIVGNIKPDKGIEIYTLTDMYKNVHSDIIIVLNY